LILDYNAAHQIELWESLAAAGSPGNLFRGSRVAVPVALAAFGMLSAAALRLRRRRRAARRAAAGRTYLPLHPRPRPPLPHPPRVVPRRPAPPRRRPAPAGPPRESAPPAGEALAGPPPTAALADLPARAADLFYRVRFGGRPLDDEESRALDAQLDRLEAALQ